MKKKKKIKMLKEIGEYLLSNSNNLNDRIGKTDEFLISIAEEPWYKRLTLRKRIIRFIEEQNNN